MNSVTDIVMIVLFVLFMVFIFGGYHKTKSAQREADAKKNQDLLDKES
ncbi:hypothetical protein KJ870_06455 [bacterium]|jgi:uncharacterized membrane protein|nr:hypothetical protein [bacterium]MBU1434558.1 hypothetical protein [bacterium]MBU1502136.1 hypothetical protein [bacterium]MBU3938938.1 hypothetical protein [bacterium]MBU4059781.1 hypothetical protein [bacterium]